MRKQERVTKEVAAPTSGLRATGRPNSDVGPTMAAGPTRSEPIVTSEDIRIGAHFLSLEHGGKGGNLDFWLLAERELRSNAASGDRVDGSPAGPF